MFFLKGNCQKTGNVIRMHFFEHFFYSFGLFCPRFYNHNRFVCFFNLAIPGIEGKTSWKNINTSSKIVFKQMVCSFLCCILVRPYRIEDLYFFFHHLSLWVNLYCLWKYIEKCVFGNPAIGLVLLSRWMVSLIKTDVIFPYFKIRKSVFQVCSAQKIIRCFSDRSIREKDMFAFL